MFPWEMQSCSNPGWTKLASPVARMQHQAWSPIVSPIACCLPAAAPALRRVPAGQLHMRQLATRQQAWLRKRRLRTFIVNHKARQNAKPKNAHT